MSSSRRILSSWLILFLATVGSASRAQPVWEVAVMFLGANEPLEYQQDIDKNLMELSRLRPSSRFRLSLYREFADRAVEYFPDPASQELHPLKTLLSSFDLDVKIAGRLRSWARVDDDPSVVAQSDRLKDFFSQAFSKRGAKRALIVYGHGLGFEGMQIAPLKPFKAELKVALPARSGKPLDLLWLDACFMASAEVAHELKSITPLLMASQEAEFSAGAPFDSLEELLDGRSDNVEEVAKGLAERFLESYSFLEEGSQTSAVVQSSATISLIDTENFATLLPQIKKLGQELQALPEGWKETLARRLAKHQMDKKDLVDFGRLLLELKSHKTVATDSESPLRLLIDGLEFGTKSKFRTNPRILARPPKNDSLLVYGYEKWSRGHEGDDEVLEILPPNLKPDGFIDGPKEKRWPKRPVKSRLYLTPFTVGLEKFSFFFADPVTFRPVSKPVSHVRHSDYVTFAPTRKNNPLRLSGYTQGIGKSAEKYTGLNIAIPTAGVPNLTYLDLDFYEATGWTAF